jgi:hypothetical protein
MAGVELSLDTSDRGRLRSRARRDRAVVRRGEHDVSTVARRARRSWGRSHFDDPAVDSSGDEHLYPVLLDTTSPVCAGGEGT